MTAIVPPERPEVRDDVIVEPGEEGPGSVIVHDPRTGHTHRLNPLAAAIARLLDGSRTPEDVREALIEQGEDVDVDAINEFIEHLNHRLLFVPRAGDTRLRFASEQRTDEIRAKQGQVIIRKGWGEIPLEQVYLREDLRYGCLSCGACCSSRYKVRLRDEDAEALEKLDLRKMGVTYEDTIQETWDRDSYGNPEVRRYLRRDGTRCVFLSEDRLCEIHRHFGYEHKPLACRIYPFQPLITPTGAIMSFRPECSTQHLSARTGPLVVDRKAELWAEISDGYTTGVASIPERFIISSGHEISWSDYLERENRWVDVVRADGWRAGLDAIGLDLFEEPLESPKPLRAVMVLLAKTVVASKGMQLFGTVIPDADVEQFCGTMLASIGVRVDDEALEKAMPHRRHYMDLNIARLDADPRYDEQTRDYVLDFITSKWQFNGLTVASGLSLMALLIFFARRTAAYANVVHERPLTPALYNEALIGWHLLLFNSEGLRARLMVEQHDPLEVLVSMPSFLY